MPRAGVPRIEDLRDAARRLVGVAVRTPLVAISHLVGAPGASVALKCEQLQPIGAFKIRGAYTAIARLSDAVRARGVVTQSSGNHGLAVAFAAQQFGVRAVVVMPESVPRIKADGVRRFGAEVVLVGARRSPEQLERAERFVREEGLTMIPPYEHPDVIAGQGTCGLEILEQCPDVDTILVPVSGGGLLSGIALAVAALKPSVRVIGVEPAGAAKLSAALAAGAPVRLPSTASIADGLLTPSVGESTFRAMQGIVREAVTVSDDEIAAAMRFLYEQVRLEVEPSGAVTTAALRSGRVSLGASTVAVVSGGNVDADLFQRLVSA